VRRFLFALSCMLLAGAFTANAQDMTTARLERSEVRFLEGMSDHHQMALDMANDCLAKAQTPSVVELCQAVITAQTPEIEQMQAWLLEWYNIEYAVMSMGSTVATDASDASENPMSAMMNHMGHMGDMMSRMDDMMSQMSTMMRRMDDMMGMMGGMGTTDPGAGTDHSSHDRTDTTTDHSNHDSTDTSTIDHSSHGSTDTSTDHSGHNAAGPHSDPAMMMGMFAGFNRLEGIEYEIAWLESMIDHHDDAIHMSERLLARGVVHEEVGVLAQAIIDAQTAEIELMETMIAELTQ